MSGKTSRRKGAAWQAELAKRWRDSGLFPAAYSSQGAQTRSGRRGVIVPPDIDGTPFAVETKHVRGAGRCLAALEQSEDEALARIDARPAIAIVRPHQYGPDGAVVVMRLPVFEARERELQRLQGEVEKLQTMVDFFEALSRRTPEAAE